MDYYSDFVEVSPLRETTSAAIIKFMRVQCSRHGIPFAEFANQWEFLHVTSSPYYPSSNCKTEWAVKVVKGLFKKILKHKKDCWLSLVDYRILASEK